MPFSDSVKLDAKRKANFRCVVCQQPWVEVHHIAPEAEHGPDTLDNAAPLCGSCHGQFGGNPELRKQLREMRDHWWARCSFGLTEPTALALGERLDQIKIQIESGTARQDALLGEVKNLLLNHLKDTERAISSANTVGQALSTANAYATSSLTAPTTPIYSLGHTCPRCGRTFSARSTHCTTCGVSLR